MLSVCDDLKRSQPLSHLLARSICNVEDWAPFCAVERLALVSFERGRYEKASDTGITRRFRCLAQTAKCRNLQAAIVTRQSANVHRRRCLV